MLKKTALVVKLNLVVLLFELVMLFYFANFLITFFESPNSIPKPRTYLRANFPEHQYHDEVAFGFFKVKAADIFTLKDFKTDDNGQYTQEIDLGPINGTLRLLYRKFDTKDSLATLISSAYKEKEFHKIMADRIDFENIIDFKRNVFGTFFNFKGNTAVNYQFYLTDSSSNFVWGEVELNCRPNYDSLKQTNDYLKVDLLKFVNSIEWTKK